MKRLKWIMKMLGLWGGLIAQTSADFGWAPVGAKWYYSNRCDGYQPVSYLELTAVKDTVLKGRQCTKLEPTGNTIYFTDLGMFDNRMGYTYQSNDSVYFFNISDSSFFLTHVFNVMQGQEWIVNRKHQQFNAPIYIHVDSISYLNKNGFLIKKIHTSFRYPAYQSCYYPDSTNVILLGCLYFLSYGVNHYLGLYENIGFDPTFLLINSNIFGQCVVIDIEGEYYGYGVGKLRCYYHPTYGWFYFDTVPCDYTDVSVKEYQNKESIQVYVAEKHVYVKAEQEHYPIEIKLSDVLGRDLIKTEIINSQQGILLSDWPKVLILSAQTRQRVFLYKKIIHTE